MMHREQESLQKTPTLSHAQTPRRSVSIRWRLWTVLALFILCSAPLMGASCQTIPVTTPTVEIPPLEEPEDPEMRQKLQHTQELLEQGKYKEARRAADSLLHTETNIADRARIQATAASFHNQDYSGALIVLAPLLQDNNLHPELLRAAMAYRALALHAQNKPGAVKKALKQHPGQQPSTLLVRKDRAPLLLLLAKARQNAQQPTAALEALSWLYEAGDANQRNFARSWGLEILRKDCSPQQLRSLVDSEDDYTRALAGAALLYHQLDAGTDPTQSGEIFRIISGALARIEEGDRAEELALRLAGASGPRALRVGVLLPLSGRNRVVGARALEGMMLAHRVFRPGETPRITVLIADTKDTPEGAAQGAQRLVKQGATLLLGPLDDDETRAAAQMAKQNNIPLIALNQEPAVAQEGTHVFRLFWNARREVEVLLAKASASGAKRIGVLSPELPVSQELAAFVQKKAAENGLDVAFMGTYPTDTRDFRKQAREIARANIDALFVPDTGSRVGRLMPFLATEALWCKKPTPGAEPTPPTKPGERRAILCMGNSTWLHPHLLRDGGSYVNNAVIAASYSALIPTGENQTFARAHRSMLGVEPDLISAFAYDAMRVGRHLLLSQQRHTPEAIQQGLQELAGFRGLLGKFHVTNDGDIGHEPALLTIEQGQFSLLPAKP